MGSFAFLSTLSLRRATVIAPMWGHGFTNFYPRSPCGERRVLFLFSDIDIIFLSTLSLRRATVFFYVFLTIRQYFYPRSPCGERPGKGPAVKGYRNFYPRSPCGERQCSSILSQQRIKYFYPRSPCGERLSLPNLSNMEVIFLSTLSLRRATV